MKNSEVRLERKVPVNQDEKWKKNEKKFDKGELNVFADCVYKLIEKNSDQSFKENMKTFEKGNTRTIEYSGFKKLAKIAKYRKPEPTLQKIFDFIDHNDTKAIAITDLEEFINKYSLDGGDGSRVAEKYLTMIENRIIEEIKFSKNKKSLKSFFLKSTFNKEEMKLDDFHQLILDIDMKRDISAREVD